MNIENVYDLLKQFNEQIYVKSSIDVEAVKHIINQLNECNYIAPYLKYIIQRSCLYDINNIPQITTVLNDCFNSVDYGSMHMIDRRTYIEFIKHGLRTRLPLLNSIFISNIHNITKIIPSDLFEALKISFDEHTVNTIPLYYSIEPITQTEVYINNDDVESLMQLSTELDYGHYEHCFDPFYLLPMINQTITYISAIEYAAYMGAVKCFKFLLLNGCKLTNLAYHYALSSGNTEIIKICWENGCFAWHERYMCYILPHRNVELFDYAIRHKMLTYDSIIDLFIECKALCYYDFLLELRPALIDTLTPQEFNAISVDSHLFCSNNLENSKFMYEFVYRYYGFDVNAQGLRHKRTALFELLRLGCLYEARMLMNEYGAKSSAPNIKQMLDYIAYHGEDYYKVYMLLKHALVEEE